MAPWGHVQVEATGFEFATVPIEARPAHQNRHLLVNGAQLMHVAVLASHKILYSVAYGSILDLVRTILYRVATSNPNILESPGPEVLLTAFAESSINFELRVFCLYEFGPMALLDQLHTAVYREFPITGISIAYPQLDVHVQHEAVGLSRTTPSS